MKSTGLKPFLPKPDYKILAARYQLDVGACGMLPGYKHSGAPAYVNYWGL